MLVFIFYRVLVLLGSFWGLHRLRLRRQISTPAEDSHLLHRYTLVFPVYKEHGIVASTFAYYADWLRRDPQLLMIFVGTAEEPVSPTTLSIVEEVRRTSDIGARVIILEEKGKAASSKAGKVNAAIAYLQNAPGPMAGIVVFDCDARVEWEDFLRVDSMSHSLQKAGAISFVPRPKIDHKTKFLVKCAMLHHFERIACFEFGQSALPSFLRYPMGATMILPPRFFDVLGRIPEPIDDVPLGYLLARIGAPACSVPFFTNVLSPPSTLSLFRQHIPIFTGVFSIISTLKKFSIKVDARDYVYVALCYALYASEFVSIGWAIWAAFRGNFYPAIIFVATLGIVLFGFDAFSLFRLISGCIGYILRLLLFLNFLRCSALSRFDATSYKTPRE